MVQLAKHEGQKPVTIHVIAAGEHLTPAYVGKLMRILRQGKLVDAVHGPSGGYTLARPANAIAVGEILGVLDGRLFEAKECGKMPGGHLACVHTSECAVRSLWASLDLLTSRVVNRVTLADLVRPEQSLSRLIHDQIPAALAGPVTRFASSGVR
jgi:Rrf2 family iron-sulfur cluster assembly transcriptional regulator